MARKQKKLTRKERQQQHQEAITRRRAEKGWIPPHERQQPQPDLAQDLEPLLGLMEDVPDGPGMEALMILLADSGDLAHEPELENIIIDPFLTVITYIKTAEQMGLQPEDLDEMPEEERDDTVAEIMENTTRELLTNDLRQEIIDGLDQLRHRLRRARQYERTAKAAALQSYLGEKSAQDTWPLLGLTQTIVERSLEAGFKLFDLSEKLSEAGLDSEATDTWLQDAAQTEVARQVEDLLNQMPGLNRFIKDKADSIWDEGLENLSTGHLDLRLFTEEELAHGFEIFTSVMGGHEVIEEMFAQGSQMTRQQQKALVLQVNDYLGQILTLDRIQQLRQTIKADLEDEEFPKEHFSFTMMLNSHLQDENASQTAREFLVVAFLGEMRAISAMTQEEDQDDPDGDETGH
jgi:hypothetical protein